MTIEELIEQCQAGVASAQRGQPGRQRTVRLQRAYRYVGELGEGVERAAEWLASADVPDETWLLGLRRYEAGYAALTMAIRSLGRVGSTT